MNPKSRSETSKPLSYAGADLDFGGFHFGRVGHVLAVCLFIFVFVLFFYTSQSWEMAIYRLAIDGGSTLIWILSATGIGILIFGALRAGRKGAAWRGEFWQGDAWHGSDIHPALAIVTCAAVGIGAMSLIILGLGLAGLLNRWTAMGLLAIGIVATAFWAGRRYDRWSLAGALKAPASWQWLWVLLMPLLAIAVAGAMFPPGMLWGGEPNGYDVTEYHLQVPREWFEAHRIIPLNHNVFSYMPFNVEMHYLLAMHLRGGPWEGMFFAQMMHVTMCALAIVAIFGIAGGGARGTIAGVLAGVVPWPTLLAPMAYNEGGVLLFGTLAIGWALHGQSSARFVLAGAMAGFAAGVKLTAVPELIAGLPIALFVARGIAFQENPEGPLEKSRPGKTLIVYKKSLLLKTILLRSAIFILTAMLVFSPWLIRNFIWARNPVFPEAMSILGRGHFSQIQMQRWEIAYQPNSAHASVTGRFTALWQQVLADGRFGYLLFPLGLLGIILSIRKRTARFLLALLVIQLFIWLAFTHLQSRFLVQAIPILALLIATVDKKIFRIITACCILTMAILSIEATNKEFMVYVDLDRKAVASTSGGTGFLGNPNYNGWATLFDITRVPPGVHVNLLGEAQAFYYQLPMSQLSYKTVFDVDTTDPSKTVVQDWAAGMPTDGLAFVNRNELNRFARTYYGIPAYEEPK
jgi:hypothetical protein